MIAKKAVFVVLLIIVAVPFISGVAIEKKMIESLEWLAGYWVGEFEGVPFEVQYSNPNGGVILGASKEYFGSNGCFFEFELFYQAPDSVILIPYPNGRQSVAFLLTDYDPKVKEAKFVNYDHDFPTDISYRVIGDDSLIIEVAGPSKNGRKVLVANLSRK